MTKKCIYEVNKLGVNVLYDICNNTTIEIPWGVLDYFILIIFLFLIIGFAILIYKFTFDL